MSGRRGVIRRSGTRSGRVNTVSNNGNNGVDHKLFVKNLPSSIHTHRQLEDILQGLIPTHQIQQHVTAMHIPKDRLSNRHREIAFINCNDTLTAQQIIARLNGLEIEDRSLVVCFSFDNNRASGGPKYTPARERMFDTVDAEKRTKLQFDDVSEYSVTPISQADLMSRMILTLLEDKDFNKQPSEQKSPSCIVDGTACVGGNTISFAKFFAKVFSFELDSSRFGMLKNNIEVLDLQNTHLHEGSFMEVLEGDDSKYADALAEAQTLFLDPPWGGPDYKKHKVLQLHLDEVSIPEICEKAFGNFKSLKMICLKLPNNYDFNSLVTLKCHVLWARFNNVSLIFLVPESVISMTDFTSRVLKLPLKPIDAIFCRIWQNDKWTVSHPTSLQHLLP